MSELEHVEHGFGPVWDAHSRVLLLGSMPSPKSRSAGFYYMHPRNRFWHVLQALYVQYPDSSPESERANEALNLTTGSIESRAVFLLQHHIALWDVLESCDINGASDATIRNPEPTNLVPLLTQSSISYIFTTGKKAAALFSKYSQPNLESSGLHVSMRALPSTSSANASMHLPELIEAYRIIRKYSL
ncbi:DNA-deoxyinosine glycosylase [Bifidobacterium sp.]|uniref:DNA-deoxyinosine glycosylase n=1 Tax=Bifidobacterium sp. TaxID=41200 RepID=UPI0025BE0E8E|nr:DNA-deoxyinosine glycosylase [Bifidobacterium sp.]MCI1635509.1 DNA-deoxyinosine glycosylase [Bifidobacterium sp.]